MSFHSGTCLVFTTEALEELGTGRREHSTCVCKSPPHFIGLEVREEFNKEVVCHV